MRGLVSRKIRNPYAMTDARMSHRHHSQSYPSHNHNHSHSHSHSSHPQHQTPAPPYAPSASHPSHHYPSRHVSNGPPPVAGGVGPQPMSMGLPHDGVPPPSAMSNGHGHSHGAGAPPTPTMSAAARAGKDRMDQILGNLATANENTWMLIGAVAEQVQDQDRALRAFETALRHNPTSILALNAIASIARSRDDFDKAIEYFQRILNIKQDNGEVWGSMGHCLLMKDDLPKAYTAYQQALYHLPNPKEPKLWYGIGILYDRYGSFEHAEEAFSSVLRMDPNFEKANEIYFRLGIIYKHQRKYQMSLDCFRYILNNPPRPLTSWDIWFQLGHVYEQDRDYEAARDAYNRVLEHQPDHAKVLQQLGWLHHQPGAPFADQEKAVAYLTKSLETDGSDAQSWYLLGRAFMAGQRYNKAYEAYQQAVYRDGRNPTFWCSIGVLYYQINQYRDALDAYSRAIRLNPYISEVWYNLGSLYESCNNQITDAIDAYSRAAELDPTNQGIKQRLSMLQNAGSTNQPLPPAPGPIDVHPSQYSAQPAAYPPGTSPGASPHQNQVDGHAVPAAGRDLPPPPPGGDFARNHSPGPFRGGAAPPPLAHVDESRGSMSRHAPLAPMEMERPDPRGDAPMFNGSARYEQENTLPAPARRHAESPTSPRRRGDAPPYQQFSAPPSYRERERERERDREREEWERRSRLPPGHGAGPDPRGPSPRLGERPPNDPRQPSPRIPSDSRDYPRQGPGEPYGFDRAPYYDPRYDPRGGAGEAANVKLADPAAASRSHSVSRDEFRGPSPAPSTASRASTKRKKDDDKNATGPGGKKVKEEKQSKRASNGSSEKEKDKDKDKKSNLKVTLQRPVGDEKSPMRAGSPAGSARATTPQLVAPTRTLDEDYDEGAADALMTLHGDRPMVPTPAPESAAGSGSGSPKNVSAVASGIKRPASPSPSSSPSNSKKAKPDGVPIPPTSNSDSPSRRTTVIEVLNTPRVESPAPGGSDNIPEAESKDRAEGEGAGKDEVTKPISDDIKENVDGVKADVQPELTSETGSAPAQTDGAQSDKVDALEKDVPREVDVNGASGKEEADPASNSEDVTMAEPEARVAAPADEPSEAAKPEAKQGDGAAGDIEMESKGSETKIAGGEVAEATSVAPLAPADGGAKEIANGGEVEKGTDVEVSRAAQADTTDQAKSTAAVNSNDGPNSESVAPTATEAGEAAASAS